MSVWPSLFKGWVGGFRPFLPWTIFVPPSYLSHPKTALGKGGGLREISPAGKHSQLSNRKIVSMLPEWTNPKLFLQPYGHLGLAFPTPDHCEAKASKTTKELYVGDRSTFTCRFSR